MKFNFDKRYLKLCKYIGVTTVLIYLAFRLIDSVPHFYDNVLLFMDGFWDISFPIILGFVIAFLMFGPTNAIEKGLLKFKFFTKRKRASRAIGITVSYVAVIGLLIGLLCGVYFMIGGQISQNSTFGNIMASIIDHFENNSLSTESLTRLIEKLHLPFGDLISSQMGNIANFLQSAFSEMLDGIASFIFELGSNLFSLIISVTLSIYVLASYEYFADLWDKFFYVVFRKKKSGTIVRRSLHIINETFSKYIRGQLIEAAIVALLSTAVLTVIGVDYAFVVGIICGIFNLIPYIGPLIGICIAAVITLFSGEIWMVIATIVSLFIIQQIDCNFLCPRIVGDIVGLHPALVLIAVTVGGNWYGLFGMIIAVPIAATLNTLINDWFSTYIKANYEAHKETEFDEPKNEDTIFQTLKKKKPKSSTETEVHAEVQTDSQTETQSETKASDTNPQ